MPVANRITLRELRRRATAGLLTDAEIRRFFVADEDASRPFAPAVKLDRSTVDPGGEALRPQDVADILARARKPRRRMPGKTGPELATAAPRKTARKIRVLAEGDSWFDLPDLVWPRDAMDYLAETHDVLKLAKFSATLQDMVARPQYRVPLQTEHFRHFFLSGGGNDILGSIENYVRERGNGGDSPANAPEYVKAEFDAMLKRVMKLYRTVADDVRAVKGVTLYVHGYANAIPVAGRKYLGKPLAELGFDPGSALARAIVAELIDRFNRALAAFAQNTGNVVYINLRDVVGDGDWNWDEIHPSASGARRIAARFRERIAANAVGA